MLFFHIFDLRARYFTELLGESHDFVGIVSVDVHAKRSVAAGHDQRIAMTCEQIAQGKRAHRFGCEHELGAEAVLLHFLARSKGRAPHRVPRESGGVRRSAWQHSNGAFHEVDESLAAGVDHLGFFQHGELLRRLLERLVGCTYDRMQHGEKVGLAYRSSERSIRCARSNRENRPFNRLQQCLPCCVHGVLHSGC